MLKVGVKKENQRAEGIDEEVKGSDDEWMEASVSGIELFNEGKDIDGIADILSIVDIVDIMNIAHIVDILNIAHILGLIDNSCCYALWLLIIKSFKYSA